MVLNVPFKKSQKVHLYIGFSLAIWIYLFLVFVGPYDASPLSTGWRAQLMLGYGVLFFLSHVAILFFQRLLFKTIGVWNIFIELTGTLVSFVLYLPVSFAYYRSEVVLGEYSFGYYTYAMYLPTLVIVIPLVLLLRWTFVKYMDRNKILENKLLEIRGENKLDILRIPFSDLVCAVSSRNYVEIFYFDGSTLQKKLLRTTLSKIHKQNPGLLKSHRSYLLNPAQFVKWEAKNSIRLNGMSIPVSRHFKSNVANISVTRP